MEATLQLNPPAFLKLTTADGAKSVKVDVYEARRALELADKQPTEEKRMEAAKNWLAAKLAVDPTTLAESNAFELYDTINALIAKLAEERKKKLRSIADSQPPIPASPATTELGP